MKKHPTEGVSVNYYPKAISILASFLNNEISTTETRNILTHIAQKHPSVLVKAYDATKPVAEPAAEPDYMNGIRAYIKGGQIIKAVKQYREFTGVSLLEAKNFIDSLRAKQ